MKINTKLWMILLIILLITVSTSSVEETAGYQGLHHSIEIAGNNGFTLENGVIGGTGTRADPYIIKARIFHDHNSLYGISVQNTNKYFAFEPCEIIGNPIGIHLQNVEHGSISNCLIKENGIGVLIESSSHIQIFDNEIIQNSPLGGHQGVGIKASRSSGIKIYNNTILRNHDKALWIASSSSNKISQNIVKRNETGLFLDATDTTQIEENIIKGNDTGLKVRMESHNGIHDNYLTGNSIAIQMEYSNNNEIYHNWVANNLTAATDNDNNNWYENWWEDDHLCVPSSRSIPGGNNRDVNPYCQAPRFAITCTPPGHANLGKPVSVTYTIQVNQGYRGPGDQNVTIEIRDPQGDLLYQKSWIEEFDPEDSKTRQGTFGYTFSKTGSYKVDLQTETDSCQATITVTSKINWEKSGIFPNPATSAMVSLYIDTDPSLFRVKIYDLSAKLVFDSGEISYSGQGVSLDLSSLSNGLYFYLIQAIVEGKTDTSPIKKLLIQR